MSKLAVFVLVAAMAVSARNLFESASTDAGAFSNGGLSLSTSYGINPGKSGLSLSTAYAWSPGDGAGPAIANSDATTNGPGNTIAHSGAISTGVDAAIADSSALAQGPGSAFSKAKAFGF